MRIRRAPRFTLLLAFLVAGCASPAPTATDRTTDPSAPPSASAPAETAEPDPVALDLDGLLASLDRTHPNAWHGIEREDFVAALDAYESALPEYSPEEAVVELMRVTALLSREGRDGHQFALPLEESQGPALPLTVYEFAEGVTITAAAPPNEALVGNRIIAIAGTPIEDVLAAIEPLVPRDGPATVPAFRPIFLPRTEVLRGLGIAGEGPIELTVERGGREVVETIEPVPSMTTARGSAIAGCSSCRLPTACAT